MLKWAYEHHVTGSFLLLGNYVCYRREYDETHLLLEI